MSAERNPSPLLATLATVGGLVLLLTGRNGATNRPARAMARQEQETRRATGRDDDRGHGAASPTEIPARGWWDIAKRTVSQISDDRVMTEAAGITFYALLALFPAIGALISIYGLFADPATINDNLATLSGVIPGGGMDIITDTEHFNPGGGQVGHFGEVISEHGRTEDGTTVLEGSSEISAIPTA